jgi:hypothetical protein
MGSLCLTVLSASPEYWLKMHTMLDSFASNAYQFAEHNRGKLETIGARAYSIRNHAQLPPGGATGPVLI